MLMNKKEVCSSIHAINYMIDFIIYDGKTARLGNEGRLVRNGALHVTRTEHYVARCVDNETIIRDYINHLFGKDKGYANFFGMGGEYGHYIDYMIKANENGIMKVVYDVQVNVEPNNVYMSPSSKMNSNDINLDSEWYYILCEEYYKEKEIRAAKTLKRKL